MKTIFFVVFSHQNNGVPFGILQLLRTAGLSCIVGGANAQTTISLAGAHLLSSPFDFSESVQSNSDNVINIHESSSSVILSAFYIAIIRIHSMIIILSVLFIVFFPFFTETL